MVAGGGQRQLRILMAGMDTNDDHAVALARRLSGTGKAALLLDFDGTLVPLAPTPDAVRRPDDLVERLAAMRHRLDGAIAIVSGRSISAIDRWLAPLKLDCAGLHGAELRLNGKTMRIAGDASLAGAKRFAARRIASLGGGILLEDKELAFALHWREDVAREADALLIAMDALAVAGDGWRLQRGNCVAEILPATIDKGLAVQRVMAAAKYRNRCPIYCGDDLPDEAAFAVVQSMGGVGVKIGAGASCAQWRLADPAALANVLANVVADR
jgi:trehalose 6-phosphate phosphatase